MPSRFRFEPYCLEGRVYVSDDEPDILPSVLPPPYDERQPRHAAALGSHVRFFPISAIASTKEACCGPNALTRLFFGQMPLYFTDEELKHAVWVGSGGCQLFHIERIVKWKNDRAPTGCAHAYCREEDREKILSAHRRVLFDNGGVWCVDAAERAAMVQYVKQALQQAQHRPATSGLLTVEMAQSDYVPDERYSIKSFR
jgi:hypothetical protein